jgi:N-methylhydantoinase A
MAAGALGRLRNKSDATLETQLDIRYVGQEFTLSVPVDPAALAAGDRSGIRKAFDALYEHRYQHSSPEEPVEVVNVRVAAVGRRTPLSFPGLPGSGLATPRGSRPVYLDSVTEPVVCPIYERDKLPSGATFNGPAIVQEHGTTTVMFAGDRCTVAPTGELIIAVGAAR